MNFVAIHGAPGVGKLTVAKELERVTGFKLIHNHLTTNIARVLFEFGSEPFSRLIERLRLDIIEAAAAANIDLLSTFAYSHSNENAARVERMIQDIESLGVRICLIELSCSVEALEGRVQSEGRRENGKAGIS
jgi:broad-specificity NMP kinase